MAHQQQEIVLLFLEKKMIFREFISKLNNDDKKIYSKYSKIRGAQQFRIIFEVLNKENPNVTFKDVNSFIIFDKAIKDVLFKYLAVIEEYIRNDILLRFDFDPEVELKKNQYHYFTSLPRCIKKNNSSDEITEFYKRFALNFSDLVTFLKEYDAENYDNDKLNLIKDLRNAVMHHSPLLFDCDFKSKSDETMKRIETLVDLLPTDYKQGCVENLRTPNEKTRSNINKAYYKFLLFKEEKINNV